MPAVELTGHTGLILENLKDLLAEAVLFQTWTGEVTAVAAEAHIGLFDVAESFARPRVLINWETAPPVKSDAHDGADHFDPWVQGGVVQTRWEKDEHADHIGDPENGKKIFYNEIEAAIADMKALAGTGERLSIEGYQIQGQVIRESDEIKGDETKFYQLDVWINL